MKRVSRSFETIQRENHLLRGSCVKGFEPASEFRMRRSVMRREMRRRIGVNDHERGTQGISCVN